jgi:hypothetical protein
MTRTLLALAALLVTLTATRVVAERTAVAAPPAASPQPAASPPTAASPRPAAAPPTAASPALPPSEAARRGSPCAIAAIKDVRLPSAVPIDEIRVVIDERASTGVSQVTVDAAGFDRVLRVAGTSHGLSFHPALTSAEFRVTVDPDLASSEAVCVRRVELVRAGIPIATVVL